MAEFYFIPDDPLSVFNSVSQILIGGKFHRSGDVQSPFQGYIAGLVFNGERVFDHAQAGDSRAKLHQHVKPINLER